MRFLSSLKEIEYVVIPRDTGIPGVKKREPGIRAEFKNHLFDSLLAQKRNRWSDETREMVESYLLDHEDFERGKHQREGIFPRLYRENQAPETVVESPPASDPEDRCLFFEITEDGSVQCGRKALKNNHYCGKHLKQAKAAATAGVA